MCPARVSVRIICLRFLHFCMSVLFAPGLETPNFVEKTSPKKIQDNGFALDRYFPRQYDHTLSGKQFWMKNINFSWRKVLQKKIRKKNPKISKILRFRKFWNIENSKFWKSQNFWIFQNFKISKIFEILKIVFFSKKKNFTKN